ncbi:predicted protein [Neisseria gonorrhoeae SK-93-1035]|nr:predicted protein [Neisseria gonorrhoeae PID332]EEZ58973.1 predicted protein [Neisseria gonorrhoeae SK-93-1035]
MDTFKVNHSPNKIKEKCRLKMVSDGIKKPPSLRLGGGRAILRTLFGFVL